MLPFNIFFQYDVNVPEIIPQEYRATSTQLPKPEDLEPFQHPVTLSTRRWIASTAVKTPISHRCVCTMILTSAIKAWQSKPATSGSWRVHVRNPLECTSYLTISWIFITTRQMWKIYGWNLNKSGRLFLALVDPKVVGTQASLAWHSLCYIVWHRAWFDIIRFDETALNIKWIWKSTWELVIDWSTWEIFFSHAVIDSVTAILVWHKERLWGRLDWCLGPTHH